MNDRGLVDDLLTHSHVIALVGYSIDPSRPSNSVARYLRSHGFRVIPVNPLLRGAVSDEQLAAVQRRRERSVRLAQKVQGYMQENIAAQALRPDQPFRLPLVLRVIRSLPFVRNVPARVLAFGAWPSTLRGG